MNETKTCVICGKEFKPKMITQLVCSKECRKEQANKRATRYYYDNQERVKERIHNHYINRKEEKRTIRECRYCNKEFKVTREHIFYCSAECQEQAKKIRKKQWLKNNKDSHKESVKKCKKKKYHSNIDYKMQIWSRKQIKRCLVENKKQYKTSKILNYTPNQLKQRLESQFKSDMNWSNHGTLWHIDHKKPLSLFNFELPNGKVDYHQVFLANCLANLQPMYATENRHKSNKFIG